MLPPLPLLEPKGTAWHPHRGFETVTYLIDGEFEHQDSSGGGGRISNGDTQWMTAGSGLLHIEAPPEQLVVSGGLFHGFQLWVNLPARKKWSAPRYQDIRGGNVRLLSSHNGRALIRVIAGEVADHHGPGVTHTPITMLHLTIGPGARVALPWRADFNALAYVLNGSGGVGAERRRCERASWPPTARGMYCRSLLIASRRVAANTWTCCCSAACRSASRWSGTGRS